MEPAGRQPDVASRVRCGTIPLQAVKALNEENSERSAARPQGRNLGTFLGVYTPSLLTILGVVLFLRTGWVVGNVGLLPALLIVVLSHLITAATALSVSAIATNMQVGGGGAYYMISRSLGLEFGGSIGIPLFLAQTFSVTLYAFGLAEVASLFLDDPPLRLIAASTVVAVTLLAGRGAQIALRLQLPIMAAIGVSLLALVLGVARRAGTFEVGFRDPGGESFWVVFAVFFPAVTGLMAGVSLSGELTDPRRSIPRGTLAAVASGFLVYLCVPIVLALGADLERLRQNNLIWFDLALVGWLVFPGLFGAIFSSAVGSILGAPRTLLALSEDRVLPRLPQPELFGRKIDVPLLLSAGVALGAVALGDLNAVAPVLTMFFLTTYAFINLVAGIEQLSGAPSYRPTIRVPWAISLVGAVGCIWVMFLIHPLAAALAVSLEAVVYFLLRRRSFNTSWGDLRYGALMSLARAVLLQLRRLPQDPRNWRPHILVFSGDPAGEIDHIRIAAWLNQNRGILTVCRLLIGSFAELAPGIPAEVRRTHDLLDREGLIAFAESEVVPDLENGMLDVCQANGIAGVTSNTIQIGWSDDPELMVSFLRVLRHAATLGKSTVISRVAPRKWFAKSRRIDVWWGGLEQNGDMLLLFAHLISANREWSNVQIQVKSIETEAVNIEQAERKLQELVGRTRIDAEAIVLPRNGRSVREIIPEESRHADLVLMGLQEPPEGQEAAYLERLTALVGELPTVLLVKAAGPYAGLLLTEAGDEPEIGVEKRPTAEAISRL